MTSLFFLALLVFTASVAYEQNNQCTNQGGTCQHVSIPCSGISRDGKCSGGLNIRCCLPPDQDVECTSQGGTCQHVSIPCSGISRDGKCSGGLNIRCCLPNSDK